MSSEISFLTPEAAAYATRHVELPYPVMRRIEEEFEREPQPAVGRGAGALLRLLARVTDARRAVEVGTNVGYSGLWIASGMRDDGRIDTIEFVDSIADRAEQNFREAGVGGRVTVHREAALDVLPRLEGPVDLVFLDAAKEEYPQYLDHAARLLRRGGILAADNAFWVGRAWDASDQDEDTQGVRELARRAFADRATWSAATVVPIEDGVLVAVRA